MFGMFWSAKAATAFTHEFLVFIRSRVSCYCVGDDYIIKWQQM